MVKPIIIWKIVLLSKLNWYGEAFEAYWRGVSPHISVEEEGDFGGVTIGSNMKHPISLFNNGSIQATVFIDLERYPEFTIGLAPAGDGQQTDLESVFVPVMDHV